MAFTLEINEELFNHIDEELLRIEQFHRQAAFTAGMTKAGKIVEERYRQNLPMPGYPGDKKGKKPLRDTISTKVKLYHFSGRYVTIVGAEYPAGAHAHLIEEGHDIVISRGPRKGSPAGRVGGFFDLARAVEATRHRVDDAVIAGIREAIEAAKASPQPGAA